MKHMSISVLGSPVLGLGVIGLTDDTVNPETA